MRIHRLASDEGSVDGTVVGQCIRYLTAVPLVSYVGENVGFIGGKEMGLTDVIYVSEKGTSEDFKVGSEIG